MVCNNASWCKNDTEMSPSACLLRQYPCECNVGPLGGNDPSGIMMCAPAAAKHNAFSFLNWQDDDWSQINCNKGHTHYLRVCMWFDMYRQGAHIYTDRVNTDCEQWLHASMVGCWRPLVVTSGLVEDLWCLKNQICTPQEASNNVHVCKNEVVDW